LLREFNTLPRILEEFLYLEKISHNINTLTQSIDTPELNLKQITNYHNLTTHLKDLLHTIILTFVSLDFSKPHPTTQDSRLIQKTHEELLDMLVVLRYFLVTRQKLEYTGKQLANKYFTHSITNTINLFHDFLECEFH